MVKSLFPGTPLLSLMLAGMTSFACAQEIREVIVTGARDSHTVSTADTLVAPADTARLLETFPGANSNKNGELTGIAQYRGMYGDRVNIAVNGHRISSSGPNAMDAPLHYAPVALLESLVVHRGIAPVSSGMETIGGSMKANTFSGEFEDHAAFRIHSRLYAGLQSVNAGNVTSGLFSLANNRHLFATTLLTEEAGDSRYAKGSIQPSAYDRDRYSLRYGYQDKAREFGAEYIINKTGKAGTASLPMDIDFVDSDIFNLEYRQEFLDYAFEASLSAGALTHGMSNFHLRQPPVNENLYRYTLADSDNRDFSFSLERYVDNGLWRAGIDGHFASHDTRIHNPNAGMFSIDSFSDINRNLVGLYLEREAVAFRDLALQAGVRINHVEMTAGRVGANLNPMNLASGMPVMLNAMAIGLSEGFNNGTRRRADVNHDLFARASVPAGDDLVLYVGVARKSRSPSYQERFAWLPLEISGGLADGKTYIGDIDLSPESSAEVEFGADLTYGRFEIYPRFFYKKVSDYIQGVPASDAASLAFAALMANMGMGSPAPLMYANVDARLHGMDVTSRFHLSNNLVLRGTYSMVRGEREDIADNLYRISPDNLMLALDYTADTFVATIEIVAYARQDRISATNLEQATSGYSLFNLALHFNPLPNVDAGLGIDNVFDRNYEDHLAGYNRAVNDSVPLHARLPGPGRNIYGRIVWRY